VVVAQVSQRVTVMVLFAWWYRWYNVVTTGTKWTNLEDWVKGWVPCHWH